MSPLESSARSPRRWLHRPGAGIGHLFVAAPIALVLLHGRLDLLLERTSVVPVASASVPRQPRPALTEIVREFQPSQNVTDALLAQGVSGGEIRRLVEGARPVYDLRRVGARRPYWLVLGAGGALYGLRYPVDDERYLTVYRRGDDFVAAMKPFPYEHRLEVVTGTVDGSLFQAVLGAGESDQLALELARIFTYDVDFYTDLQPGDRFRLLVEKRYLDGRFVKYASNPIAAATLTTGRRVLSGYRYRVAGGGVDYYGGDGRSLRKSFLKSPLQFARVSSKFSHGRFHPILKKVRPHLGVDYGAPVGTPVVAVASATVVSAGMAGGGGKVVRLRHSDGLETFYLHLSRIAVRPGARVAQGEIVGYVGATGLATGPHLDFRVSRHGRFINPAAVVFPPAPPIPDDERAQFETLRRALEVRLAPAAAVAGLRP